MIVHLPDGAKAGIVMLHGRGGSARDILGLLPHTGRSDIAAAAPEAVGNSWWPTSFLAPAAQMAGPLDRALSAVSESIAKLEGAGLPRSAIWLLGFSQGAGLALESYARLGDGLAGVFAFSGGLVGQGDLGAPSPALYGHADKDLRYSGTRKGRAWISVHERDPHIPLKRAQDSAQALQDMGAVVEFHTYPGAGHSVMAQDIAALQRYLTS